MLNLDDSEPSVQSEQKRFLQKPLYLVLLLLLCIAIARRKFAHNSKIFSIYKFWKWISIYLLFGSLVVTFSMMIQCNAERCYYQYPSPETLKNSDNIFLEIFGNWPGIGIVVVTMSRTIFNRVLWSFYLPWPFPLYFMISSLFRQSVGKITSLTLS